MRTIFKIVWGHCSNVNVIIAIVASENKRHKLLNYIIRLLLSSILKTWTETSFPTSWHPGKECSQSWFPGHAAEGTHSMCETNASAGPSEAPDSY